MKSFPPRSRKCKTGHLIRKILLLDINSRQPMIKHENVLPSLTLNWVEFWNHAGKRNCRRISRKIEATFKNIMKTFMKNFYLSFSFQDLKFDSFAFLLLASIVAQLETVLTYSSSCNLTQPISRALIVRDFIFCPPMWPTCCNTPQKCAPVKYKAGFQLSHRRPLNSLYSHTAKSIYYFVRAIAKFNL